MRMERYIFARVVIVCSFVCTYNFMGAFLSTLPVDKDVFQRTLDLVFDSRL